MPTRSGTLPILHDLAPLLQTRRFGRSVRGLRETTSTNSLAARWAEEGAPEGSLVFAEYQTAGRGRFGRSWSARPGLNLTFSLVLRPRLPADRLGLITLSAGIAVAQIVSEACAPLEAAIKWPNDVQLDGRKCCGMLLESVPGQRETVVVLGVGLNVNQDAFPEELSERATSLLLATGRPVPRAPLLAGLLREIEARYIALSDGATSSVVDAYCARLTGLGTEVAVRLTTTGAAVRGRFAGIADSGALLLETPAGTRVFHAGEVTFERPDQA